MDTLPLMLPGLLPADRTIVSMEKRGAVFTKRWVVELVLDLAGYTPDQDLAGAVAVEPAAGDGAFLIQMARRLLASCQKAGKQLADCGGAIIAYELDPASASVAHDNVVKALVADGVSSHDAERLAASWLRTGDFLLDVHRPTQVDFVVGNPPYIRLEDIPEDVAAYYRILYPTMKGRADLYIAFYEAALRMLIPGGTCAFICADRWMLNQYGGELRKLITSRFAAETIIEMHQANAFEEDVSAYPAVTVIRKSPQAAVVVASLAGTFADTDGQLIAGALQAARAGKATPTIAGVRAATVPDWFRGADPWPCRSPEQLSLLKRLEAEFAPLESAQTGTKVGIGVATGADRIFITTDPDLVEPDRLLPLAMGGDTLSGELRWSGHYLVNPWQDDGLVDLDRFPRLQEYFEQYGASLKKRHVAQKNAEAWYRTIDRVHSPLTATSKLYVPDIKDVLHPVLDRGETYPHHNLYIIQSERWNLEVLGGLLMSAVAQFFIESYGVRMRGGYLRFQAQYLRRIRVPDPMTIPAADAVALIEAFRSRDTDAATAVALKLYRIKELPCHHDHQQGYPV